MQTEIFIKRTTLQYPADYKSGLRGRTLKGTTTRTPGLFMTGVPNTDGTVPDVEESEKYQILHGASMLRVGPEFKSWRIALRFAEQLGEYNIDWTIDSEGVLKMFGRLSAGEQECIKTGKLRMLIVETERSSYEEEQNT
jgi:hypothetical protein